MMSKNLLTKAVQWLFGMAAEPKERWLLLRGLTRESAHWGEFTPKFQAAFPNNDMYTLDLPGTGVNYRKTSPATIHAITEQVRNEASKMAWLEDGPVQLLAISLGGMIAWDWLQNHPVEIKAAVLINISLAGVNPFYERLRWQCYPTIFKLLTANSYYQRELEIIKLVSNRTKNYVALAQDWGLIQQLRPVSTKNATNQLLAAARYRPATSAPLMPVLLLNSRGDRMVKSCCTESIANRWRLPYRTHPSAGHELCLDDGDWIINQIETWQLNHA
jgi:pimeloyl-[acyl-carrier protein] methyl ester esterase